MKGIVGKIIKSLIWILLSLIVLFNIYNFINLNILKKDLSTIGGYTYLEVVSGSMEPTIKIGDLILINTNIDNYDYHVDDIITFRDEAGSLVTHRIIKVEENTVVTQGDANNAIDGDILKKDIVGIYVKKFVAIGSLLNSLKNPVILVIILTIGILICFIISTDKSGEVVDVTDLEKEFIEYKKEQKKKKSKRK